MSKGGSQTTETKIPEWVQDDVEMGLERGNRSSQIGFMPFRGPTTAALNPMQISAMQNVRQAANAGGFNVGPMGLPKAQTFGKGRNAIQGYSSMPIYNDARQRTKQATPGQYRAVQNMFINPRTGAKPKWFGGGQQQNQQQQNQQQQSQTGGIPEDVYKIIYGDN